jgi:hypothetical protein
VPVDSTRSAPANPSEVLDRLPDWLIAEIRATRVPARHGLWIAPADLVARPRSGAAWDSLVAVAEGPWGSANLRDLNSQHDVRTLAGALVAARTGSAVMRQRVVDALHAAMGTEHDAGGGGASGEDDAGSPVLAVARNLQCYVLAADLIRYRTETFEFWLESLRTADLGGRTLVGTNELRPNNWGLHAGAALLAIDLYLGNWLEVDRAARVFRAWLGEASSHTGFRFGALDWQPDPAHPTGVVGRGVVFGGRRMSGAQPEELRRCDCPFDPARPFPKVNYSWGALQAAVVQAELLERAGWPAYQWGDRALFRAARWLEREAFFPAEGDDAWIAYVLNTRYAGRFATAAPGTLALGKNAGFTDWTHAGR